MLDSLDADTHRPANTTSHPADTVVEDWDPWGHCDPDEWDPDRAEIAAMLKVSRFAADRRLDFAVQLGRLPRIAAMLAMGLIDVAKAHAIVEGTCHLSEADAREVEGLVRDRAARQTPAQFKASVTRAVAKFNPPQAQERRDKATEGRKVITYPLPDGQAELTATGPAEAITALYAALSGLADAAKTPADGRSMDQRRFAC